MNLFRIILFFAVAFIALCCIDSIYCTELSAQGTVIDGAHSLSTDNKVAYSFDRKLTPVIIPGDDEEWALIVRQNDGEIVTVEVSSEIYYATRYGQSISFTRGFGCITGINYHNFAR